MFKQLSRITMAVLLLLAIALPGAAATQKIAHANLQKALNDCAAGKVAKDNLQKSAQKLEADLSAKQEELVKMKTEIDNKHKLWNKETLQAKEELFIDRSRAFEQQYRSYKEELDSKKQAEEAAIIEEFAAIIEELAKKRGYSYVIERSIGGLLYASPGDDLTAEVIKIHNKRFSKRGK